MYLYNQRQSVVLLEPGALIATRRYEIVYAKELTVIKGVDNILEFAMINQDQKPVNIDGKEITARIISYDGTTTLLQKSLIPIYALTGITSLQLTIADLAQIDAQKAYYSLEIPGGSMYVSSILITTTGTGYTSVPTISIVGGGGTGATATAELANGQVVSITITNGGKGYTSGPRVVISPPSPGGFTATATISLTGSDYAVFVDSQGGGRGVLNIVNSTLPSFIPAQSVTIPSHPWPPGANGNGSLYTSSTINTKDQDVFTLQTSYANFTGTTAIEGSIMADFSLPYQITAPANYYGYSGTVSNINVVGPNTWVTQTVTDADKVFVGANVINVSGNANVIVTAIGTGNGNIELSSVANLSVGGELIFSTNGYTGTIGINVTGYHPYVRMAIKNLGTIGTVPTGGNLANLAGTTYYGGDIANILYR
jgi:hypothetical protein